MLDNDYVLYILMRTDMDSMNPGKACAQASHASSKFVFDSHFGKYMSRESEQECNEWMEQSKAGFGTTITLAIPSENALAHWLDKANDLEVPWGLVFDETYPVQDGAVTHLVPVGTCGYILINRNIPKQFELLENLPLLP